jgi:hypothetical protein
MCFPFLATDVDEDEEEEEEEADDEEEMVSFSTICTAPS